MSLAGFYFFVTEFSGHQLFLEVFMLLSQIWIYPVKSLPGIQLDSSIINERGFAWDRHWMLVDDNGDFLSQRSLPAMALIRTGFHGEGILLQAQGQDPLTVNAGEYSSDPIRVTVWKDSLDAYPVSQKADEWFSKFLGESVRMVCFPDDAVRVVDQDYAQETDQTGFSDGFPFLLLGQASIEDLNSRVNDPGKPMEVRRFRPNLLIEGATAYAEDQWRQIQIGNVGFRVVKPCSRCKITTLNPDTAEMGAEPLKTLSTYRRQGNQVYFGQNLIHDSTGSVSVGDEVLVIA